jgi:hypothetical protein
MQPQDDPIVKEIQQFPKTNLTEESTVALIKALVSVVPLVGGSLNEFITLGLNVRLSKRVDKWRTSIVESVIDLYQKYYSLPKLEELFDEPKFITAVANATYIATLTHQEEKLEALRNAVLNSGLPDSIGDDLQLIFLNYIRDLTPWHLKVLTFADDPIKWQKEHNFDLTKYKPSDFLILLGLVFPELENKKDFYTQICDDLDSKGLAAFFTSNIEGMPKIDNLTDSRTTPMGKEFLKFITSPIK